MGSEEATNEAGTGRVYKLMKDGLWHRADTIRRVAGGDGPPASEGLRRLRDLRARLSKTHTIEKRRIEGSRLFEYRLVRLSSQQEIPW